MRILLALLLATVAVLPRPAAAGPRVLAAASLQEAMTAAADAWARTGHRRPRLSFAASSALARQVAAGAPADLFVSADVDWMDDLSRRGLLRGGTRANLVGNRLVLVARAGTPAPARIADLGRALGNGRLAVADPAAVPAGRYARAALERTGAWAGVADQLARAENVRAALALVERGAAPFGIVYATDARAARGVRVVATFPAASHPPIRYPIAVMARATHPDTAGFRAFLLSPRGRGVFASHGFTAR